MPISINGYTFEGPFYLSEAAMRLRNQSGVYVVLTLNSLNRYEVLDVGESATVRDRICNSHERESCWRRNNQRGLYVAAYYCSECDRMRIERILRNAFNPACGVR